MARGRRNNNDPEDETTTSQGTDLDQVNTGLDQSSTNDPAVMAFNADKSEEEIMAEEDVHGDREDSSGLGARDSTDALRSIQEQILALASRFDRGFSSLNASMAQETSNLTEAINGLYDTVRRRDELLWQRIDGMDSTGTRDALLDEMVEGIHGIGSRLSGDGASGRSAGGVMPGSTIEDTLLQVLGTRVRPERPGDLRSALDRAFVLKEEEGRTVVDYRGTSGTASLPVEPGYVTSGPQAVLYKNAQSRVVSVRQALAELEADDDDEQDDFEAVREVLDSKIVELVGLLGHDVRPPVSRVDALFTSLIGEPNDVAGFEDSLIGELKSLVGFDGPIDRLVDIEDNTRDEDRATTRFLEIYFYVRNLRSDWNDIRHLFSPDIAKPLGTQLEMTGLYLNRVAELRDDLDVALTGASVDAAEREFLWVNKNPYTSMAELMDWLTDFARTGKTFDSRRGIEAIQRDARKLYDMVISGLYLIEQGEAQQGLRNRQVRKALGALRDLLDGFRFL